MYIFVTITTFVLPWLSSANHIHYSLFTIQKDDAPSGSDPSPLIKMTGSIDQMTMKKDALQGVVKDDDLFSSYSMDEYRLMLQSEVDSYKRVKVENKYSISSYLYISISLSIYLYLNIFLYVYINTASHLQAQAAASAVS